MTLVNLKPSDEYEFKPGQGKVLLLACGALGREIVAIPTGPSLSTTTSGVWLIVLRRSRRRY